MDRNLQTRQDLGQKVEVKRKKLNFVSAPSALLLSYCRLNLIPFSFWSG